MNTILRVSQNDSQQEISQLTLKIKKDEKKTKFFSISKYLLKSFLQNMLQLLKLNMVPK